MDKDVDFAMKYSEERKKRLLLEKRLMGLLYETMAQHEGTVELIHAIASADGDNAQKLMHTLTRWRCDTEAIVYLNLFVPAVEEKMLSDADLKYKNLDDMPAGKYQALKERLSVHAEACFKDWVEYAKAHGLTPTGIISASYEAELQAIMKKTMETHVLGEKAHVKPH